MKKFAPVLLVFFFSNAFSQSSLLKYGQAVMTSGNYLPDNWSFMVYDIRNNGTAVPGMNWMASIYHPSGAATDWKFSRTGPLFGITIDNSGNIFLASCKLLGAPYPPGTAGPGGVYKVDAFSWAVTDFITSDPVYVYNPSTNKIPNHADGLGDICYDKYNDQLFLTNFEDGKIYRISTSGTILSVFDPFSPDLGIVAVADYGERCWAVNVYKDSLSNARLYFSRIGMDMCSAYTLPNEIWSVELDPLTGDFMGTEQLELFLDTSLATFKSPVSDICFDKAGNMYLAQRSNCGVTGLAHRGQFQICARRQLLCF